VFSCQVEVSDAPGALHSRTHDTQRRDTPGGGGGPAEGAEREFHDDAALRNGIAAERSWQGGGRDTGAVGSEVGREDGAALQRGGGAGTQGPRGPLASRFSDNELAETQKQDRQDLEERSGGAFGGARGDTNEAGMKGSSHPPLPLLCISKRGKGFGRCKC